MSSLDNYLDRLGRELQASPEEAGEVLREIRSHLELAVLNMGRRGNNAVCTDFIAGDSGAGAGERSSSAAIPPGVGCLNGGSNADLCSPVDAVPNVA